MHANNLPKVVTWQWNNRKLTTLICSRPTRIAYLDVKGLIIHGKKIPVRREQWLKWGCLRRAFPTCSGPGAWALCCDLSLSHDSKTLTDEKVSVMLWTKIGDFWSPKMHANRLLMGLSPKPRQGAYIALSSRPLSAGERKRLMWLTIWQFVCPSVGRWSVCAQSVLWQNGWVNRMPLGWWVESVKVLY